MPIIDGPVNLSHRYISWLFPQGGDYAIDATLGRGKDSLFLAQHFKKVAAMDIQGEAVQGFQGPDHVTLHQMDHSKIKELGGRPDLIVYNLGYLPGSDHRIRTQSASTIRSLKNALDMLKAGGFIIIAFYRGHDAGEEAAALKEFLQTLPGQYGVLYQEFINRPNDPPGLVLIEKSKRVE